MFYEGLLHLLVCCGVCASKQNNRETIELQVDVELKDTIMVAMPNLVGERFYMCTIRVKYEWKHPRCSSCNVFYHVLDECPKHIVSDVKKNLKNPRQAVRGVQVDPKMAFKPIKQVYRLVFIRNNAGVSGKKKQFVMASKGVSNSNSFDVLNSVEKDDDLERQIINEKLTLVENDGKPLPTVVSTKNADSNSEVEDVVDDHAVFMASTGLKRGADSGYDANSLETIELQVDVELKDTIMVAMPNLVGERFYMCTIRVKYEWKHPRCSSCNVFYHVLDECPKHIVSDVKKNLKNPRQAVRGVQVDPKMAFKPIKQVYRLVFIRNNAGVSGKKKQFVMASKGVSNSNSFDVLNSVEKDDDLERQIINEKLTLVENDGKPLPTVVSTKNADSNSEVEDVVDDHAVFMASTGLKRGADSGYDANSLLDNGGQQKRDDDYSPYDDDDGLYESHDMSENLQAICDELDITVRDRKKK
nr:hypothetical protein [Tanacetum cinerariifolium]